MAKYEIKLVSGDGWLVEASSVREALRAWREGVESFGWEECVGVARADKATVVYLRERGRAG